MISQYLFSMSQYFRKPLSQWLRQAMVKVALAGCLGDPNWPDHQDVGFLSVFSQASASWPGGIIR